MKEVAIDIDQKSPEEIRSELRDANLSNGDHLKLVHAAKTTFAVATILFLVWLFFKMQGTVKSYGDKILDDLFGRYNSEEELEAEIEKEYGIKVTVEPKLDPDREDWMSMSATQFNRGYADADDIYDSLPLEEPNPDYIPWKKDKS